MKLSPTCCGRIAGLIWKNISILAVSTGTYILEFLRELKCGESFRSRNIAIPQGYSTHLAIGRLEHFDRMGRRNGSFCEDGPVDCYHLAIATSYAECWKTRGVLVNRILYTTPGKKRSTPYAFMLYICYIIWYNNWISFKKETKLHRVMKLAIHAIYSFMRRVD